MKKNRIAVIGCGNIGMSIIEGVLRSKVIDPENIIATRRNIGNSATFDGTGVRLIMDNVLAVNESDIIIIAVKSYNFNGVLDEIKDHLIQGRHMVVSITTGVTISHIQKIAGKHIPVFRAMPNIGASIGSSVSCISHSMTAKENVESVKSVFDSVGKTMIIDEDLMESATILGSCGIAFVLRFIRAMIQGGIQIGFDAATASAIVTQTVKGAAELLIERHQHPEYEIDKVTTPKGCTIVGLNEMEHNGFSSSLIKGIVASFDKIEK
jgi:pyrroline-5-carboxylate reductase